MTLTVMLFDHWQVVEAIRTGDLTKAPARRQWFAKRVMQFQAERPDIKFVLQNVPYTSIATQVIASSLAGQPPDAFMLSHPQLLSLVQGGYVAPLDDFKYDEWDDFLPSILKDVLTIDGKKYALATYVSAYALMYNKKHFAQAGITAAPTSWDDVARLGKLLTQQSGTHVTRWGYGSFLAKGNQETTETLAEMVWSQGGDILNASRHALMDTAEMRKSVQQMADLINTSQVMSRDVLTITQGDQTKLFQNETWSMGQMPSSYFPPVISTLGMDNVGVAPLAKFPGGRDVTSAGPLVLLCISKKAAADKRVGQAAFDFNSFLAADETLAAVATGDFGQPSRISAAKLPVYASNPILKFFADYAEASARALPHMLEEQFAIDTLADAVQLVVLGQKSPAEALKDAQAQYDARVK